MLCLQTFTVNGQTFRTEALHPSIKTLRVQVAENWLSPPVIELNGNDAVEISFDELGERPSYYVYKLIHCNADWTPSTLIEPEYMTGFQYLPVEDYVLSFNTTVDYIHYKLDFPNENTAFKTSGNYAVIISPEKDQNIPVLTACFSVVETEVSINMQITSNTDIDFNRTHQQVSFDVLLNGKYSPTPQDYKVYVQQNHRRDNQAELLQPLMTEPRKLTFAHNPKLIFEAGNEYRRFEHISNRYNGIGIENVEFHSPYYHVDIYPELIRSKTGYSYDQDINGRFFIRSTDASDYDWEADYAVFHFYFPVEQPFLENIYMLSGIHYNIPDNRSLMTYNRELKAYEMNIILKQGHYNYMFVTKKSGSPVGSTALIEGNYYETENEYSVYVYHRPFGGRYDRLIGVNTTPFR